MVEISTKQNYVFEQQLAFFTFVCSAQLFLALRYSNYRLPPLFERFIEIAHFHSDSLSDILEGPRCTLTLH